MSPFDLYAAVFTIPQPGEKSKAGLRVALDQEVYEEDQARQAAGKRASRAMFGR